MKLSIFDKERWFEVREPRTGSNFGIQRSLGEAMEVSIRELARHGGRVEIWQCEGNHNYQATLLMRAEARLEGGVLFKNGPFTDAP